MTNSAAGARRPLRAVVVGAGICGCSAAAALRRRWGPDAEIEVFDSQPRVGGRIRRQQVAGIDVETGASLFHSGNRLLTESARESGLTILDAAEGRRSVGIWDGRRLLLRTGRGKVEDRLRLLGRYRLCLTRSSRLVVRMVADLETVYAPLSRGQWWSGPEELLGAAGLDELARESAQAYLRRRAVGGRFVTEFADGVSRNNYGQDATQLNAFAELVSLAGAGLGGGTLHRIGEGNSRICDGLLHRAGARLRLNAAVGQLQRSGRDWVVLGDTFEPVRADVVVLAAPQELSSIRLPPDTTVPVDRHYKTIHAVFVIGTPRSGSIGPNTPPDFILTTRAVGDFYSVERLAGGADGALYKLFTPGEVSEQLLHRLFARVDEVVTVEWSAYPLLTPTRPWPSFRLAEGLYYPSAMEHAVSTMETQAIAGVAAANLAAHDSTT